jgi:hypothetical protein
LLYVVLGITTPIIAIKDLDKHVTAATNSHGAVEELLDASFSRRSLSYERKVGD